MKKWIAILLIGLFSCGQSSIQTTQRKSLIPRKIAPEKSDLAKLGNNPSNIINDGLITADNDRIYYVGIGSTEGMFSMKHDGSEIKKLSSGYVEYLNVLDGWLYYRKASSDKNPKSGGLYKMRTDGTEEQRLTSGQPFYINVVGNWIYYVNWSYTTDICKIKIDGESQQVLFHGHYDCLTTDGHKLYFGLMVSGGRSLLYSSTLDGKELKQVFSDTLETFFADNGWIYFTTDYGSKLCRVNTNTSQKEVLAQDPNLDADMVIHHNGALYLGGVFGISRFDLNNRKSEKIFSTRVINFGIASNYAYITTATWDKQNIRHTKTFLTELNHLEK